MTEASELFGKFQEFWRAGKDARLSMEGTYLGGWSGRKALLWQAPAGSET